uniref:Uncharacterized protein n=1 Tax=Romanomermis culicivorax TaxID=13658 RepID=A0A915L474_ROMCU
MLAECGFHGDYNWAVGVNDSPVGNFDFATYRELNIERDGCEFVLEGHLIVIRGQWEHQEILCVFVPRHILNLSGENVQTPTAPETVH